MGCTTIIHRQHTVLSLWVEPPGWASGCLYHLYLQISRVVGLCVNTLGPLWVCFCSRKPLCHSICGLQQEFGFHLLQQLPFFSKWTYIAYSFHGTGNCVLLTRDRVQIQSTVHIKYNIRVTCISTEFNRICCREWGAEVRQHLK